MRYLCHMIPVVCAIIAENGKLLIVQHGALSRHPWKWEFPGGKVKPGEKYEDALAREIKEELNLETEIKEPLEPIIFAYETKTVQLIPFLCIRKSEEFTLNEHTGFQWITLDNAQGFDLLPADRLILENGENYRKIWEFIIDNCG
jgi:8-oxo-dGTP diphosphatase